LAAEAMTSHIGDPASWHFSGKFGWIYPQRRETSCYILVVSMKNYDNYEKRTQKNGKVKGWKQLPYVAILSFRQSPSSPEKGNAWPHQKCHF